MNLLLGVTGSVAAIKTPQLVEALRLVGHEVKIVATRASTYFFDPQSLEKSDSQSSKVVYLDEDEWPGREQGLRYQREDLVLHIELRRWAEALVIAPLDANTLAKLAGGLADNCLSCVYRAWTPTRRVVLAPAMNTLMWEHPATRRHLGQIAEDFGLSPPRGLLLDELPEWINQSGTTLQVLSPESRRLACGDIGVGAMASLERIVAAVTS